MRIVVCVKQVPDTQNINGDAMTPEGNVNRSALPAIFNPEDLNALEMGLQLKDRFGLRLVAATMGPPKAAEVLKDHFEIFLIDDQGRNLIFEHWASTEVRTKARELGMRTLREDGLRKVVAGQTTLSEVLRVTMGDSN